MKPICYIFGAGESCGAPSGLTPNDYVIAADGGYLYARSCGITPDLLIGDFDSLPQPPAENCPVITLPHEKNDTDMSAALNEGKKRGYKVFHIYGGTGGRSDHTFANIQCLAALAAQGMKAFLFEKENVITAISNDKILFSEDAHGTVSVFSHSDVSTGVRECGLKYSLENATLTNTYPLGVSNEFIGEKSLISVSSGILILIYPKDIKELET